MKIYDVSPTLHPGIAVWPGDSRFEIKPVARMSEGDSMNLSTVTLSLHTGAHVDAFWHFSDNGGTIDQAALEPYLGEVTLFTPDVAGVIGPESLAPALEEPPCRLIVRCNPGRRLDEFDPSFPYFSIEAAQALVAAGVRLIGTDSPSVDEADSKDFAVHHLFGKAGTAILEGLVLDGVPDGRYELIALPLKIAGGDGSPVRAVLRTLPA